jgi:hypothetical protein
MRYIEKMVFGGRGFQYVIYMWYLIIVVIAFFKWFYDPNSRDALFINTIVAAAFGMPWILKDLLTRIHPYHVLHTSGSDIYAFDPVMADFVARHTTQMKGKLTFYNIPLQTFDEKHDDDFKKIWIDAVGKNTGITEVRLLLDETKREKWKKIVNCRREYFRKHGGRFKVKFDQIRSDSLLAKDSLGDELRKHFGTAISFSHVNFGLWASHEPNTPKTNDLVTVTAEDIPWGENGTIHYFLAVTDSKPLAPIIRNFVMTKYDKAPGDEMTAEEFL